VGTVVTWIANIQGDVPGNYRFRFIVRGFDQRRRVVKDFGPENTLEWAAAEHEGFYVVEVTARNNDTGETTATASGFQILSNVVGNQPTVLPTLHPLVFLYSAPVCPLGSKMRVYFLAPDSVLQNTPAKECDGIFSTNFYIAGLRASTFYYIKHIIEHGSSDTEGPVLSFTSGAIAMDLPSHAKFSETSSTFSQPVVLAGSLFANFVATDLEGNIIWYYPRTLLFLTKPEPGGYFFGIHEVFDRAAILAAAAFEHLGAQGLRRRLDILHDLADPRPSGLVATGRLADIVLDGCDDCLELFVRFEHGQTLQNGRLQ
jgi:hypothetical protein